jgi:hypothetical protein
MSLQVVATRPRPALINRIGFGFAIDYDELVKLRKCHRCISTRYDPGEAPCVLGRQARPAPSVFVPCQNRDSERTSPRPGSCASHASHMTKGTSDGAIMRPLK